MKDCPHTNTRSVRTWTHDGLVYRRRACRDCTAGWDVVEVPKGEYEIYCEMVAVIDRFAEAFEAAIAAKNELKQPSLALADLCQVCGIDVDAHDGVGCSEFVSAGLARRRG